MKLKKNDSMLSPSRTKKKDSVGSPAKHKESPTQSEKSKGSPMKYKSMENLLQLPHPYQRMKSLPSEITPVLTNLSPKSISPSPEFPLSPSHKSLIASVKSAKQARSAKNEARKEEEAQLDYYMTRCKDLTQILETWEQDRIQYNQDKIKEQKAKQALIKQLELQAMQFQ